MKPSEGTNLLTFRRNPVRTLFAYTLLVMGSLLFLLPFSWMLFTSMKVGKELFSSERTFLPRTPSSRLSSPYLDFQVYNKAITPVTEPYMEMATEVIVGSGFEFPSHINKQLAAGEMARALLAKMEGSLPPDIWQQGEPEIREQAVKLATPYSLTEFFQNIYRRVQVGKFMARTHDLRNHDYGTSGSMAARFVNKTPEVANVIEAVDLGISCALIEYDFSKGDEIVLEQRVQTEFDLKDLHRVQFAVRPDNNWQQLNLTVEKLGEVFHSVRPIYLSTYDWYTYTWQEPGPDDDSNRIKNWVHIVRDEGAKSDITDPHEMRVTLRISRTNQLQAWWGKITLNYIVTAQFIPFLRYIGNSLYLILLNVTLMLLASSIVAYAVSRLVWPGRDLVFLLILATLMVPEQVTMIPAFLIWKNLGLYNTLTPLWLGAAFGHPVNIFLLRQFMRGIPRDVEDAAKIDGCGVLRVYWHIMLPLVRPALAAIALLTIVAGWNDFKSPLLYIADQRLYTLAFGLYAFSVQVASDPAQTMAAALLTALPVIMLFLLAQKHFIKGVTLTGIKG